MGRSIQRKRKSQWQDVTGYSQSSPRGTVEPRSWELRLDWLRICVTRMHSLDGWFLRAHDIGIDSLRLTESQLEWAKIQALDVVETRLRAALDAVKANGGQA